MKRSVFYFGPSARPTNVHTDPGLAEACFVKNEVGAPHTSIAVLLTVSWSPARASDKKQAFEEHEGDALDLFVAPWASAAAARAIMRQVVGALPPRTLAVALVSEDTACVLPDEARIPAVRLDWLVEVGATPLAFERALALLEGRDEIVWYTARKRRWGCAVVPVWAVPACMRCWGHPPEMVAAWRAQIECQLISRRTAYPDGLDWLRRLK